MTITDLIEKLNDIREKHGDLDVRVSIKDCDEQDTEYLTDCHLVATDSPEFGWMIVKLIGLV